MISHEMGKTREKGERTVQGGWRVGSAMALDSWSSLLKARQVRGKEGTAKKPGQRLAAEMSRLISSTASAGGVSSCV